MRMLIVGAGGTGGYFGARLLEKGEDVTFLVRKKRQQQIEENGLIVKSIHGDMEFSPKTIVSGTPAGDFDVVMLSTKAYHLQQAIHDIKPYIGPRTLILPLLNGISHMDILAETFGVSNLLGGLCFIETTLDSEGNVVQTSPAHDLVFGELSGQETERIAELEAALSGTKANIRRSNHIEQDMWHKYLFITTLSGVTSLFSSPIGPIREQESGLETIQMLLREAAETMRRAEAPIVQDIEETQVKRVMDMDYTMKSSLQRDMEKGLPTEAEHFFGYLLRLAKSNSVQTPLISAIYTNLKLYEANR